MNHPKILVVDDEVGICHAIQRALASSGYIVDSTTSAEEGMRKVTGNNYDLVLLDVMMPGVSGIDLIQSIHEHDPELVCVIITGYATVELAVRAIKQGAYDFLTKPFSVDDLLLSVSKGVERRKLSLESKRAVATEMELRQLTEEKEKLEELGRAKQQFINLVSHELQAPISAIQGYLYLMRDGYVSTEQQVDIIQKCLVRAEEETHLINDLLALGKIQMAEARTVPKAACLLAPLQEVVDDLREKITQKKIDLVIHADDLLPPVHILPEQIKRLWGNLVDNAVKYTPDRGKVTIDLHTRDGWIIGQVTDNGIGIPAEDQDHLFSEFFRAKNAKELNISGTGLGLVIVKRILENVGGTIAVTSDVGRGTTFTFRIPMTDGFGFEG